MNKISDVLIAPQPVVDEQKTNHLRPKILRRFLIYFFAMVIQEMQFHKCQILFLLKI